MLLLLRRLKHDVLMNHSFRKYAAYAFGELILVVVGILVALQIDNWNDDRKEKATLQSYLETIARNIREDIFEIGSLREYRLETRHASIMFMIMRRNDRFTEEDVVSLNQVRELSTQEHFFSANTSGFEALKTSGVLDRLQGSGVEKLLSRYYDTVNQVALLENSMYNEVRPLAAELSRQLPQGIEDFAFSLPGSLPPSRFKELQPFYVSFTKSPAMLTLAASQDLNHLLMLHYDSLQFIGESLIRMVETGQVTAAAPIAQTPLEAWNKNLGFPAIVVGGRPALEAYTHFATTAFDGPQIFGFDAIQLKSDEVHVNYPGGADWAAVYWLVAGALAAGSPYLDFSAYSKISLELKGDRGGEVLKVHAKDVDYPVDRAPKSVDIRLSRQWQSYEIDLADFAPIDLKRVNMPLGFVIEPAEEPLGFSVRNAHYH